MPRFSRFLGSSRGGGGSGKVLQPQKSDCLAHISFKLKAKICISGKLCEIEKDGGTGR